MKVKIKARRCIGCGLCASICPEVFEIGIDSYAHVTDELAINHLRDDIFESAQSCPTSAIEIEYEIEINISEEIEDDNK